MREGEFADFIEENIINKMDSGHVYLSATKQVVDKGKILKPIEKVKESLKNDNVEIIFQEDIAIIKIKSFSNKFINEDAYLYQNLKTYLSEYDINNIVIDIRGNNGGSDSYFRHFDIFTDKNLNIDDKVFDLFLNENTEITWTIIPAGTDKHYNKYLLVDEEVFSTAEKLTAACKQNGYATIIGAPTMGEGLGFTPFRLKLTDNIYDGKDADKFKNQYGLILKQTVLNYPTGAPINDFNEVDYENCYNTVPDIECPSKDALNVALDLINQNKKHK